MDLDGKFYSPKRTLRRACLREIVRRAAADYEAAVFADDPARRARDEGTAATVSAAAQAAWAALITAVAALKGGKP